MESNNITNKSDNEQTTTAQDVFINETSVTEKYAKILVIDDVESITMKVKIILERNGYEVITANDGQQGLEKAKSEQPDLIILDLMLPRVNGYKVCALLKRDSKYSKIPIILFTAKTREEDMKLGEEVGADAYLTKPFDPELLLSKVGELVKVKCPL